MLLELRIRDFAVVKAVSVELGPGLNALTGETGAGKSILVGAIALLMGERASPEVVRPGASKALIEGVFALEGRPDVQRILDELGFPAEDGLLILRREVAAEGRNRAWVNGSAATAGAVGELGRALVDLHGQHEHQTLLRTEEQRDILDAFSEADRQAADVRERHREWTALRSGKAELEERLARLEERRAALEARANEVEAVSPTPGEGSELEGELRRLAHAEGLLTGTGQVEQALYGGDDSISDALAGLLGKLEELSRIDPGLEADVRLLSEAFHGVQEVGRRLGDYASGVDLDPGRLEAVRSRLDELARLSRKYGSPERALEEGRAARDELDLLDRASLDRRALDIDLAGARERLDVAARDLSLLRSEGARRLEGDVEALLPRLGLPGGRFVVVLRPLDEPGAHGGEEVAFHVSLNPGFEPRPLSRVVSGGELSRVMLALKTVLAAVDRVPTLVFDEVDAGIGGRVAVAVAETLGAVAAEHQVLVVTHLAQLASRAHRHLRVQKDEAEPGAGASVVVLEGRERVEEVARMLGGDPESDASLRHARELLGTSTAL